VSSCWQEVRVTAEHGFSLLEVLIASLLIGISAVGVALMFSTGYAFVHAEGDNRVALLLAEQKLEQLRALGFAALQAQVTDATVTEPPATATAEDLRTVAPPAPSYPYLRTWSVVGVNRDNYLTRIACLGSPPSCPGPLRIRVKVETAPPDPKASPVELESIVVNR
jgi:prepilin-type N-terminal cleavage/methylation domain-containing protein